MSKIATSAFEALPTAPASPCKTLPSSCHWAPEALISHSVISHLRSLHMLCPPRGTYFPLLSSHQVSPALHSLTEMWHPRLSWRPTPKPATQHQSLSSTLLVSLPTLGTLSTMYMFIAWVFFHPLPSLDCGASQGHNHARFAPALEFQAPGTARPH